MLVSTAGVFHLIPPHVFIGIFLFDHLVGGGFLVDVAVVRLVSYERALD